MGVLLVLLGLIGLVFGLVNLARPLGWLRVTTRGQAAWVLGGSLGGVILGGTLAPPTEAPETPVAAVTTSSIDERITTTTDTSTPTASSSSTSAATTTTLALLPSVPQADIIFAPPSTGTSGDPAAALDPNAVIVTVASITDGDTLDVRFANGSVDTVRLIGVNTPESGECWGEEASLALAALASVGSQIGLTSDVSDRDQFDRLLRYLWVGSLSVNEELVRRGAAIARRYPPDTALAGRFEAAQAEAQASRRGLWASDACGPAADADLTIAEIFYDAPGNDNENLNQEWVRIRNDGVNLVDMTGWGIKDESASNRYVFPTAFSLAPGEEATVFSGCGDDFGTSLFWCSVGSAVWNNDGDTAFLTDPSGNTHDSSSYSQTSEPQDSPAPAPISGSGNCDPSYPDVCIPPPPPDLDCGEIAFRRFAVVGSDPHGFDGDNDGIGCES